MRKLDKCDWFVLGATGAIMGISFLAAAKVGAWVFAGYCVFLAFIITAQITRKITFAVTISLFLGGYVLYDVFENVYPQHSLEVLHEKYHEKKRS